MLKERQRTARRIHELFVITELQVDASATHAAVCHAEMMKARADLNLPFGVGLGALSKVSRANALMTEARQLLLEAHPMMLEIPHAIGLGDLGYGHVEPTPGMDNETPSAHSTHLRIAS